MWNDKSYEHRLQNFRPQHGEAADHDREYKKRFSRSEVRYLGHFRSGFVVRKNFTLRENFDKTVQIAFSTFTYRSVDVGEGGTARRQPPQSQRTVVCYFCRVAAGPYQDAVARYVISSKVSNAAFWNIFQQNLMLHTKKSLKRMIYKILWDLTFQLLRQSNLLYEMH